MFLSIPQVDSTLARLEACKASSHGGPEAEACFAPAVDSQVQSA